MTAHTSPARPDSPDTAERTRRLAELTLELVSIPSETGNEAEICARVLELARARAPHARLHRVGNSALVVPDIDPALPTIGLFGHLDTVKQATDQPVAIQDGRVYGCGASDMKGALAVMLELLEAPGHAANVVYVFYDKEEGPMLESGMIPVLESRILPKLDLAICLEPTDNRIQAGCVGGLHAEVTVKGRRAHSARPWQGDSAVTRAIPVLQRLAAFGGPERRREVRFGYLSFYEVMSVTQARTENSRNVVPDRLVLNVNYRFAPGKPAVQAREELEAVVFGPDPSAEVPEGIEVDVIDEAPSGAVCTEDPMLQAWQQAYGIPLEAKQAWTDVARLTELGIPAVNFGPGETAQAHQARESLPIAYLAESYRMLRGMLGTQG